MIEPAPVQEKEEEKKPEKKPEKKEEEISLSLSERSECLWKDEHDKTALGRKLDLFRCTATGGFRGCHI